MWLHVVAVGLFSLLRHIPLPATHIHVHRPRELRRWCGSSCLTEKGAQVMHFSRGRLNPSLPTRPETLCCEPPPLNECDMFQNFLSSHINSL